MSLGANSEPATGSLAPVLPFLVLSFASMGCSRHRRYVHFTSVPGVFRGQRQVLKGKAVCRRFV